MRHIDIQKDDQKILADILSAYLTHGEHVYVFGSRGKGTARKYSDLDIAIDAHGKKIDFSTECAIKGDLEESDIPYRVDIIDLNSITPHFRKLIKEDLVPFSTSGTLLVPGTEFEM
jgi:predicted nucleotidyltransferase